MLRHASAGIALALAVIAMTPSSAVACTCGGTSDDVALSNADVAFVGVVAQIEDPSGPVSLWASTGDPIAYTFAIEERRKGSLGEFVTVRSYRDGAACGLVMAVGERWSIYAHRQDLFGEIRPGELWVWLCDANERLATGLPAPPVPGSTAPIIVIGAAGLLLLAALASRRRRLPAAPAP